MPIRAGEKPLTSSSPSAAGCSVRLVPAPLCILHKDTEHDQHRVSPRLLITKGLGSGQDCSSPAVGMKDDIPSWDNQPGNSPGLWVLWCPPKSERGSGCTEKTVQRKLCRENLLLPSGTSPAAGQKSESCIPRTDHMCWCPNSLSRELPPLLALTAEILQAL